MNQSEKVHPRGQASAALSLLLFGGPLLYLLAQAWCLRVRERTASPTTADEWPGGRILRHGSLPSGSSSAGRSRASVDHEGAGGCTRCHPNAAREPLSLPLTPRTACRCIPRPELRSRSCQHEPNPLTSI